MTIRWLLGLFCWNILLLKLGAVPSSRSVTPPNKDSIQDLFQTVLFEIRSPDTDQVSYLFGTHHAFGKTFFDSLHVAKEKLLSSEIMIKENLDIPGRMIEDIVNKRTKTTKWLRYLSQEDYQYVKEVFSKSQVDLQRLTPTELYVVLDRFYRTSVCHSKTASDPYMSLDDYMASVAAQHDIPLMGLETTEEQLAIIDQDVRGMPRKVHKKRLLRLIQRIQTENTQLCAEIEKYKRMDYDYRLDQPCRNALMLTNRNNKWMPQITQQLEKKSCFIAVGLSHLMFECGLIRQLRALGYSIIPVPVK